MMGFKVGEGVGFGVSFVGFAVGFSVGLKLGIGVGFTVGLALGAAVCPNPVGYGDPNSPVGYIDWACERPVGNWVSAVGVDVDGTEEGSAVG